MSSSKASSRGTATLASVQKAHHIAQSAGTSRLNRILDQHKEERIGYIGQEGDDYLDSEHAPEYNQRYKPRPQQKKMEIHDATKEEDVALIVGKVVIPELKVDERSIGGTTAAAHKKKFSQADCQETLLAMRCRQFECTNHETPISQSALEHPEAYAKHKRSFGVYSSAGGTKAARNKIKYVCFVRTTNRPPLVPDKTGGGPALEAESDESDEEDSYDQMYLEDQDQDPAVAAATDDPNPQDVDDEKSGSKALQDGEVSSFPVLVCMSSNPDGTSPDIRKLIELDRLTTVQNVTTGGAVQLAFTDGDTVLLDFALDDSIRPMPPCGRSALFGHCCRSTPCFVPVLWNGILSNPVPPEAVERQAVPTRIGPCNLSMSAIWIEENFDTSRPSMGSCEIHLLSVPCWIAKWVAVTWMTLTRKKRRKKWMEWPMI